MGDYICDVTDGEGLPLWCAELVVEVPIVYEEVQEGVEQLGRRRGVSCGCGHYHSTDLCHAE